MEGQDILALFVYSSFVFFSLSLQFQNIQDACQL